MRKIWGSSGKSYLSGAPLAELFEWASAVAIGQGADEFLGTQGDPWDTQSDMFFALVGGGAALVGLAHYHDRQMSAVQGERAGA